MFKALITTLALTVSSPAVFAEPSQAAKSVADQIITAPLLAGAWKAQRPLISAALGPVLSNLGLSPDHQELFIDLLQEEMIAEFVDELRVATAIIYDQNFDEQELSEIDTFMSSRTGKRYIERQPILMQEGARVGQQIGATLGQKAHPRVVKRLEQEGVQLFGDPDIVNKLKELEL